MGKLNNLNMHSFCCQIFNNDNAIHIYYFIVRVCLIFWSKPMKFNLVTGSAFFNAYLSIFCTFISLWLLFFLNVCVKVVLKAFCNRWNWIVKNFSVLVKWLFLNPFEFSLQVFLVHSFGSLHLIIQDSGQNSGSCRRIHFHSRNLLLSSLDFLG